MSDDHVLPPAGSYPKLKTYQIARLVYDLTVLFCQRYVDKRSRTNDQMVQAARSGARNIAEGSVASATSKKMELKLTNVSRASLQELRLDYEDFLRHRDMPLLAPRHPALMRFKARRCATLDEVRRWVQDEREGSTDPARTQHGRKTPTDCNTSMASAALAANAALSLINVCDRLLKKQIDAQAKAFEEEGSITERLYHRRRRRRGDA